MRVLVIDLNNFSRYPTLPVGIIVAVLRQAGMDVQVLSPLARGVQGYPRLTRARRWELLLDRAKYWSAVTPSQIVRRLRRRAAVALSPADSSSRRTIVEYTRDMLQSRPDAVLLSTYTMHERTCDDIAALCEERGIPLLVGGPYFSARPLVERWAVKPGVTAVFSGEPEGFLPALVEDLANGRDLTRFPGISTAGHICGPAPPLLALDALPLADYSDFPWDRYPNRIVPIMTARGCEWARCRFCADVRTAAGRTFRSRSLYNVLEEIRVQRERHDASLFVFLDLKLNSDVGLWRGLAERMPALAPGMRWTASVHVDARPDNGLTRDDLRQAARAGLARVTTGLESASESLRKRMAKGTSLERTAAYIRDAAEAGISVRLTTILGYPGEEPADVEQTARFLTEHAPWIERVMLNRYTLMLDTDDDRRFRTERPPAPPIRPGTVDPLTAVVEHENTVLGTRSHRRAAYRLMAAVHEINRRPLTLRAQDFEGVM